MTMTDQQVVAIDPSLELSQAIRLYGAQLHSRVLHLARCDQRDMPQNIHDIRVGIKRLRSIWRLVRSGKNREYYQQANENLKHAAKAMASQRDATVALQTIEKLANKAKHTATRHAFNELLGHWHDTFHNTTDEQDKHVDWHNVLAHLSQAETHWKQAPYTHKNWPLIQVGVTKTYRQARNLGAIAFDNGQVEAYHQWRKWTKYHFYQLEMLAPYQPEKWNKHLRQVQKLGKILGRHHDLAVLQYTLMHHPKISLIPDLDIILNTISTRGQKLTEQCRDIQTTIFADKPRFFHYFLRKSLQ